MSRYRTSSSSAGKVVDNAATKFDFTVASRVEDSAGLRRSKNAATSGSRPESRRRRAVTAAAGDDLFLTLADDSGAGSPQRVLASVDGQLPYSRQDSPAPRKTVSSYRRMSALSVDRRQEPSTMLPSSSRDQQAVNYDRIRSQEVSAHGYHEHTTRDQSPHINDSSLGRRIFGRSVSRNASSLGNSPIQTFRNTSVETRQQRRHSYHPSNLINQTSDSLSPEAYTTFDDDVRDQKRTVLGSAHDGAESASSTAAPSTVWDELDELKSRIRHIELKSRTSPIEGESRQRGIADRPTTATTMTTTTTNSTRSHSLRPNLKSPTRSVRAISSPTTVNHLLQAAVAKARASVNANVYTALENSAADALSIAGLAWSNEGDMPEAASVQHGAHAFDNHIRQKANNLCRSLTELCITLCEQQTDSIIPEPRRMTPIQRATEAPPRPSHSERERSPLVAFKDTQQRIEQALSRSEGLHRQFSASAYDHRFRRQPSTIDEDTLPGIASSQMLRRATTTLSQHGRSSSRSVTRVLDLSPEHDLDPTIRIPSRALSEFQQPRTGSPLGLHDFSRDYTNQYPMGHVSNGEAFRQYDKGVPPNDGNNAYNITLASSRTFRGDNARATAHALAAARLAERIEEHRQQRVASAGILGSIGSAPSISRPESQNDTID